MVEPWGPADTHLRSLLNFPISLRVQDMSSDGWGVGSDKNVHAPFPRAGRPEWLEGRHCCPCPGTAGEGLPPTGPADPTVPTGRRSCSDVCVVSNSPTLFPDSV